VLKPKVDPGSEEYVLEQLSLAEQKLVSLAEELSSRDLNTVHKEMADEEVLETSLVSEINILSKIQSMLVFSNAYYIIV
jgi:hypothetical protein